MMKKYVFLWLMATSLLTVNGQVSIGIEALNSQQLPIDPSKEYSYGQMIFLVDDINTSGAISAIKFDKSGSSLANSDDWTIYMGPTSLSSFENDSSWVDVSTLTQVFSGTISQDVDGMVEIVFPSPYLYADFHNLVLAIDENSVGAGSVSDLFYGSTTNRNSAIVYANDGEVNNPDPNNPPNASFLLGGLRQGLPNITFVGISQGCPTEFNNFYSQNFEAYIPPCWTEMRGLLDVTSTITSTTYSNWTSSDVGFPDPDFAASILMKSSSSGDWVVSPSFDLGTGTAHQVEFEIHKYNSFDVGDTFSVVVSTDNGATWSNSNILKTYSLGANPVNVKESALLDLTPYSGVIKIGFYAEGPATGAYNIVYINDFIITPVPNCQIPLDVEIAAITENSADVLWSSGGAANVQIEYGLSDFEMGTGTSITTGLNPYNITGLTAGMEYELHIRDICSIGDTSAWANVVAFSTVCQALYVPVFLEVFSTSGPLDATIPICWTQMQGGLSASNTIITNPIASGWTIGEFSNMGTDKAARSNISGTNSYNWLISPSIDLGTGNNYQLEFNVSLTESTSSAATIFDANDTLAVVISTDNGITWGLPNALQLWVFGGEPSNTGDFIAIDLSAYSGVVKFGFYTASPVHDNYKTVFVDDFQVSPIPSCPKPSAITLTNITGVDVDVSWQNGAANAEVEYGPAGFIPGTGSSIITSSNPFNLAGLAALTGYDIYVRNICAVGDSSVQSNVYSFTTPCGSYTPSYYEDFSSVLYIQSVEECWTEMTGVLGAGGTTITNPTSSNWLGLGFGNVGNDGAVFSRLDASNLDSWLISPSIDLETGSDYELSFDVALTHRYSTTADFFSFGNYLAVVISTDNGTTWVEGDVLRKWEPGSEPSNTGDNITIDLSEYTGVVKLGFYAKAVSFGNNINVYIDNFQIESLTACTIPTALSIINVSNNSVDVSWGMGGATSAQIEYGPAGFLEGSGITVVTGLSPYTLTDLSNMTNYDFYIRNICTEGDTSYSSLAITASTLCGEYFPVYYQDFDPYLPGCWDEMQGELGALGTVITNPSSSDWAAASGFGGSSSSASASIWITNNTNEWLISPAFDLGTGNSYLLEFEVAFTSSSAVYLDGDDTLAVVISADNGATWSEVNIMQIWEDGSVGCASGEYVALDLSGYSGIVKFGFYSSSTTATIPTRAFIQNLRVIPAPSCIAPLDISIDSLSNNSVEIAWIMTTPEVEIEYGPSGFTPGTGTVVITSTNPYPLTGLSDFAEYNFYIRNICGLGDTSLVSMVFPFTTVCPTYSAPMLEEFDMYLPFCWSEMTGTLGDTGTVINDPNNSVWTSAHFGNVAVNLSARSYFGGNTKDWLTSPPIDLGTANNHHLEFNISLTEAGSSNSSIMAVDDSLIVVISPDNGITWSKANMLHYWTAGNDPSTLGDFISIDLSDYSGVVRFGFYTVSTVSGLLNSIFIDNFEIPLCPAPIGVSIDTVTYQSAAISWNQEAINYYLEYGAPGFTQGTGTTVTSTIGETTLTGLAFTTDYEFYIRDSCGGGLYSHWSGPFTFTTPCPDYAPNYTEDFTNYLPFCWVEKEGILGTTNTVFTNEISSAWNYDGFGNIDFTGAAKINFSGSGGDEWLISPTIDLGNGSTPYQVQFDVALSTWENSDQDLLGADDSLLFIISTDNGITWSNANILKTWISGSEPVHLGELLITELQAYSGLVKFGFYMSTTVTGGNVNMYIDNFEIKPIPTCQQPFNFGINDVTISTVDVSWTVGEANSYVEYGQQGFAHGTGTSVLSSTGTEVISGLMPNTNYDIYVMDSCGLGDVSLWTGPINFTTNCEVVVPNHLEIFTAPLPDCWSKFRGPLGSASTLVTNPFTSSWTGDGFGNVTSVGAAGLNIYSAASNGGRFDWLVSPSIDLGTGTTDYVLEFDVASTYYWNTTGADFDSDDSLAVLISTDNGITWSSNNILQTWTEGSEPSNTGEHINIGLHGYTGVIKLAFYGSTTGPGGNVLVYIDNFEILACIESLNSITEFTCDAYTSPSGIIYTTSGIFSDTLVNAMGCDSIISIDLTLELGSTSTISAAVCEAYVSDAGNAYSSSGVYTEYFTNALGCDSLLTLDLDITITDLTVTQTNGIQLMSNESGGGVGYQWVDCNVGNSPINGETNATFIATSNGSYACEIMNGTCVDLTDCYTVDNVSVSEIDDFVFVIYPNPASAQLTIEVFREYRNMKVVLTNTSGQIVYSDEMNNSKKTIDVSALSSGAYLVSLTGKEASNHLFITIER
jgi:hypothetical protein